MALNSIESDLAMDNNTYTAGVGSDISEILSDSFTWTLGANTGYRLEKFAQRTTDSGTANNSKCYRLYDLSGNHTWGGYSLVDSESVAWYRINTNETEFEDAVDSLESAIDNGLDDIEGIIDRRTLKNVSTYTNAFSMDKNTYYTDSGTNLTGTLGDNFSWPLGTGSYRLEKYALTASGIIFLTQL